MAALLGAVLDTRAHVWPGRSAGREEGADRSVNDRICPPTEAVMAPVKRLGALASGYLSAGRWRGRSSLVGGGM